MNRITLSGNLTRDPEVRYTQDGVTLTHDYYRCAELILQAYME